MIASGVRLNNHYFQSYGKLLLKKVSNKGQGSGNVLSSVGKGRLTFGGRLVSTYHLSTLFFLFRSPSPEPIYNSDGKRLNTREYRTRKNLEEERHKLITRANSINTEYKPPPDYK